MNILRDIIVKVATEYYMKIVYKIKDNEYPSDYISNPRAILEDQEHDAHVYHFPDNIDVSIQYSIPIIRELAGKDYERYISFKELKELLAYDIEQSKEEFDDIRKLVVGKYKHKAESLVIMYYIPHERWLLLDGRHRFVEYEKFNPDAECVSVLAVNSKMLMPAIINKCGFICYCIQQNIYVLAKYPIRMWKKNLLNIRRLLNGEPIL